MRTPLVVGNWKMNTTLDDAVSLVRAIRSAVSTDSGVEVVLCPPFPWLVEVSRLVSSTSIRLGAQNIHTQDGGAYTGEVSARMLAGLCQYVLVGQYERRILFAEKEAIVRHKMLAAVKHGLKPIICVGETAEQLDDGSGTYVVMSQLESAFEDSGVSSEFVVAYEPVWTTMGRVAPPPLSYVGDMCGMIRDTLGDLLSAQLAQTTRVIYGGQVNPRNVAELAADARLDGVLAGAASVNAENFTALVRAFEQRRLPAT